MADAPRARLQACTDFAHELHDNVFPINAEAICIALRPEPASLRPPTFFVGKDLTEPSIAFDHVDHSKRAAGVLEGLTHYGAYEKLTRPIRVVLLSTKSRINQMRKLAERLNDGSARYRGSNWTFGSNIEIRQEIVSDQVDDYEAELRRFVLSSARADTDIALVYLPRVGDLGDPSHPYFRVKGLLLREGIPSQMVDEATVLDPEWRDLNLALNISAKVGAIPWVLDEALDGADLFVGLSSSQVRRGDKTTRVMGHVNVFDKYGRWYFSRGDTHAFPFDERLQHYRELITQSVGAFEADSPHTIRSVHVHLTKSFSADERRELAAGVRAAAPQASTTFVWVNPDHHLRLYDLSPGTNGSITRATYLKDEPGRVYLATTGSNALKQQMMGTPIPLQLTVWTDDPSREPPLQEVAQHVLSLTRLNWSSTRNFCHEPITTKFAGAIARLMNGFMQSPEFSVNPLLRNRPWFL